MPFHCIIRSMKEDTQVQNLLHRFNEEFMAYQQMGGGISPYIALSAPDLSRTQTFSESLCKNQESKPKSPAYLKESIDMSMETLCDEMWVVMDKIYETNPSNFWKTQSVPHLQTYGVSDSFKPATLQQIRAVKSWFCHYSTGELDDVDEESVKCELNQEQFEHDSYCSVAALMVSEDSLIIDIQGTIVHVRGFNEDLLQYVC
ncbi:hypothetical protein BC833DRAFT_596056 [Globomyces pollinis-pini]|nr:hypothetical protein BC833DRAFT_596056 [Globomyces pollinis-pini]